MALAFNGLTENSCMKTDIHGGCTVSCVGIMLQNSDTAWVVYLRRYNIIAVRTVLRTFSYRNYPNLMRTEK